MNDTLWHSFGGSHGVLTAVPCRRIQASVLIFCATIRMYFPLTEIRFWATLLLLLINKYLVEMSPLFSLFCW